MQPSYLCAFRARLIKRGYSDVHIYILHHPDKPDSFLVSGIEPLAGYGVSVELSLTEIISKFRF